MNGAKVKRCVSSGPPSSINNKIVVLTLGFLSLTRLISARIGSAIMRPTARQTATAMTCHLNFASSTPAPFLPPLPDVNIFLLFELRDLLKEQTPGMLCSIVTKLWHFQLDIADMKRACLSFFCRSSRNFWAWLLNVAFTGLEKHLLLGPLCPTSPSKKKKKREKYVKLQSGFWQTCLQVIKKVLCPLHSYLTFISCIYFRKELWYYLLSLT